MAKKKENKKPNTSASGKAAKFPELQNRNYQAALLGIIIVSFIAYLPVLQNSFVNWDESIYIQDNLLIRSFNLKNIFSTYQIGNYHPFTMLVYAIEYKLFGLNETGYHAINLLLHLLNVYLVYFVIFLLVDKREIALITALLFGIHPLHVESVAWAAELKDLLYTFFFLASYIFYIKYTGNNQRKYFLYALLLFILSLLSKAMAVSLPVILILTDYFTGRKINSKTLIEKLPFIALSVIFGIVAISAQKESGATDIVVFPFEDRIVFACYGFITYLVKLFLPINLSAYYPYPIKEGGNIPSQYYIYVFLFIALIAYVIYSIRFSKKVIFGIGFFGLTVFLVLQLLPVGGAIMADRYCYIPSIGIFYLAGEGFYWLWNKSKSNSSLKYPGILVLTVISIFFSVKTYSRCTVWKNAMTLWSSIIDKYPDVPMAYSNRGLYLAGENKFEDALADMTKAVELVPDMSKIYLNRGLVLMYLKKYKDALNDFNKAISLDPADADLYNNRGLLFKDLKNFDEAMKNFNRAIELNPKLSSSYNNRGFIFMYLNKIDEAIADFNKSIELNPDNAEAFNNLGNLMTYLKRNDEALQNLNKAIELQPLYSEAYFNRGSLYLNEKKNDEAYNDFTKAIELDSTYSDAYVNRAVILQIQNNLDAALNDYNTALEMEPDFAQARFNRGILFIKLKRFEEAISDLTKSIETDPDNALAYYNRGIAEYYLQKKDPACVDIQKAAKLGVPNAQAMFDKFCK